MELNTNHCATTSNKFEPASPHGARISTAVNSGSSNDISRTVATMRQSESITVLVTTRPHKISESTT